MSTAAVTVAITLDRVWREPPAVLHPVRGAGWLLDAAARLVPPSPRGTARRRGAIAWTTGAVAAGAAAAAVDRWARRRPAVVAVVVRGAVLWTLVSWRLLEDEVAAVERAVAADLDAGRRAVGRIVGRDTSTLDATGVRTAAIESLAENASDAVVAPLWWFAVGGLPAAAVYRWANTADAMWGHRSPRWVDAGWAAARADDLANLVPSRLTGIALAAGGVAWRDLAREAARTPSPNAGWPIAAVALQLDVRCEKTGAHVCHPDGRRAASRDVDRALQLVGRRLSLVVVALALLARRVPWRR